LRLILADTRGSLLDSAKSAGATFNNEVDFFADSSTTATVAALEVPNVTSGVTIPVKLDVKESQEAILAAIGSAGTNTTTGTNTSTTTDTTTTDTTTNTTDTTSTDTSGLGTVTASAAVIFDATRDIARFLISDATAFALNANLKGQDLSDVGTIRSQVVT